MRIGWCCLQVQWKSTLWTILTNFDPPSALERILHLFFRIGTKDGIPVALVIRFFSFSSRQQPEPDLQTGSGQKGPATAPQPWLPTCQCWRDGSRTRWKGTVGGDSAVSDCPHPASGQSSGPPSGCLAGRPCRPRWSCCSRPAGWTSSGRGQRWPAGRAPSR